MCHFFHDDPQTKYRVIQVIFCFDKDGIIYHDQSKNAKIFDHISWRDLDKIDTKEMNLGIDVTGGLRGKFTEIQKISTLGIPTILLNGSKPGYLIKFLLNQEIPHTIII